MKVTVHGIVVDKVGNVTTVTNIYTLMNPTQDLIVEGSFKVYFDGGGGLPQYGFFSNLLPGQEVTRSYRFDVPDGSMPKYLAYPSRFFADSFESGDLVWEIAAEGGSG